MRVLVGWASRHGATQEVADVVADELRAAGHEVRSVEISSVTSIDSYEAIVLGSAVYMTQWVDVMRRFVAQHSSELKNKPVWAFSVGLSGVPGGTLQDPIRVGPVLLKISPIEHRTFAGRLRPRELSLRERSIARLGGAVEGDFRNWSQIRQWARSIGEAMTQHAVRG